MNVYLKRFFVVRAPEDGGDAGGGGGAAADRGDTAPAAASAPDTSAADAAAASAEGAEAEGAEAAADDAPARDAGGKFAKKDKEEDRIPKSRFDEQVGKERQAREAAERRAADAEARLQQEQKSVDAQKMEADIEELEQKHSKLLLDGKDVEAAKVMKEIRHAERKIATMESEAKMSGVQERAVEQVRNDAVVAKLEADYSVFNPDSAEYDQDVVDIVIAERDRIIRVERMPPSLALAKAATKIMTKFQPPASDGGKAKGLGASKGADRKAEQVGKNLDTAAKQPASMRESGKDSDKAGETKIDVLGLDQQQFNALPEATKKRLRGDTL